MAVNEGPRTKGEALRMVAAEVAGWLEDDENASTFFPRVKMSVPQRERISDAVDEVTRRLRLMGTSKGSGGEES